jgi:predicted transcriptional regulator
MTSGSHCTNPMCTCDPCGCVDECRCGAARLGELERRVMELVWREPDREWTGRQVSDVLEGYAYTTVATILDRLVHKGLLRRRLEGRIIRFSVVGTPSAHAAVVMHEALEATSDPDGALVRFTEGLSSAQTKILRQALRNHERKSTTPTR